MKKRIVIKLSGSLFGLEDAKTLKQYAEFFVKISKICQPIIIAGGGKLQDTTSPMLDPLGQMNQHLMSLESKFQDLMQNF